MKKLVIDDFNRKILFTGNKVPESVVKILEEYPSKMFSVRLKFQRSAEALQLG